ncbi:S9 family peptidase [Alicyclobacillus fastidiosus]|uniref:S9 family peptidase n=1 Tax=Alicyclobacillus fastidiosus TaxID=392011 RepID=A0ABY6ZAY8_9BACL|nr:S9 family peptidase [Alicyclobacillus fastidiosus]WAH39697.1 S9 family peptidase [Alicyclobacillus fastidiosus]GMA60913.1 putative peptidase YuxL [Alicyclobacillus fastidiosus]
MAKRRLDVSDFANFTLIGEVQISPDGTRAVFSQQTVSLREDDYRVQLMHINLSDQSVRPLTTSGKRNQGICWSPDGRKVAFVGDREFGKQIWVIPVDGGEAVRVTNFKHGISHVCWSPDAQVLYALVPAAANGEVEVFDAGLTPSLAQEVVDKEAKGWREGPKRYEQLYYKQDGTGLSHLRYPQLVRIDVTTGLFTQLTRGEEGVGTFAVAPDGSLYFTRGRDREFKWWFSDLYRYDETSGKSSLVSDAFIFHGLQCSPDGSTIAALVHDESYYRYESAAHLQLYLLTPAGQTLAHLTESFPDDLTNSNLSDLRADTGDSLIEWSSDGEYLYVLSTREGCGEVVRFRTDGSTPQGEVVVAGRRDVFSFALRGDTFVYAYATDTNPSRLASQILRSDVRYGGRIARPPHAPMDESCVCSPAFELEHALYAPNDEWLRTVELCDPEPFWYRSAEDWWIQGWVMKPAGYEQGKKYPVILEIHGGPQLNFGYAMFHEMQWFAAQGYAIVYTNPRGGKSYGQSFVNAVRHHYGENDAADVLNGLDAALEKFDFLDGKRVAVTGGSYGGFMTNWLVGHTDRFFAAVSQRSISNWVSFYGCSDIGPRFVEAQLTPNAKENLDKLWMMSPLAYATHVTTPLLLIHSENDLRCPMEQAEQFYTWIRSQGKETQLLRIPNASHGLSRNGKPSLRIRRLEAIFGFIHEHLPPEEEHAR